MLHILALRSMFKQMLFCATPVACIVPVCMKCSCTTDVAVKGRPIGTAACQLCAGALTTSFFLLYCITVIALAYLTKYYILSCPCKHIGTPCR